MLYTSSGPMSISQLGLGVGKRRRRQRTGRSEEVWEGEGQGGEQVASVSTSLLKTDKGSLTHRWWETSFSSVTLKFHLIHLAHGKSSTTLTITPIMQSSYHFIKLIDICCHQMLDLYPSLPTITAKTYWIICHVCFQYKLCAYSI